MPILLTTSSQSNEEFPVYTRSGWQIPSPKAEEKLHIKRQDEKLINIRAQALLNKCKQEAQIRSVSAYLYNCAGMVFASRRIWIDIDHVSRILREDGYRRISRDDVMIGDVVLYKSGGEPAHVGIIIAVNRYPTGKHVDIKVLSKWGLDAEFIHFIEDVPPNLGVPVEFYTERSAI